MPALMYIGILIFGYILLLSLSYSRGPGGYSSLLTLMIGIILWQFGKNNNTILNKLGTKRSLLILLFVGCGIRFLWAILVPTLPISDFLLNHVSALKLSNNMLALTKNSGYTLLLSVAYRIYPDVLTGKIINALASTFSLLLLYLIGSMLINQQVGLIAAFLFAILPSEVNMVSVLGTEVIATTIGLMTTYFLLRFTNNSRNPPIIWVFCAGLFFGLGLSVRTSFLFYIPAVALFIFFFTTLHLKQRGKVFGIFLVGIIIGLSLIVAGYSLISGGLSLEPLKTQNSFPLLAGTNTASSGTYNQDDINLYSSWPADERDQRARQEALERITSNPVIFLLLIPKKMAILMGPNDYGNIWSLGAINWEKRNFHNELIGINGLISQSIYIIIWFFAFYAFKSYKYSSVFLIVLTLVIFTLLPHFVLEVQGRYHHYIMPFIALLAACGVSQVGDRDEQDAQERFNGKFSP